MNDVQLWCPYCGGRVPPETTVCPDCQEDLAALVRLQLEHAIYYNEALALARQGEYDAARRKLLVALELCETFQPAHRVLAKVAAHQGNWREARHSAARAHELDTEDPEARRLVGAVEQAARKKVRLGGGNALAAYEPDVETSEDDRGRPSLFGVLRSWLGGVGRG